MKLYSNIAITNISIAILCQIFLLSCNRDQDERAISPSLRQEWSQSTYDERSRKALDGDINASAEMLEYVLTNPKYGEEDVIYWSKVGFDNGWQSGGVTFITRLAQAGRCTEARENLEIYKRRFGPESGWEGLNRTIIRKCNIENE